MYVSKLVDVAKDKIITHRIKMDKGEVEERSYADIRCGLFWPASSLPAFYIIIGEEFVGDTIYEDKPKAPPRLVFLLEEEVPGIYLEPLFKKMTDDCAILGCSVIYTDLDETQEEVQYKKQLYDDYCRENGVYISLLDAPYRGSWEMGVNLVRRFTDKGLLKIPEGSTRAQLSAAVAQDLDGPDDPTLYSLRALQYVVGSFHKSPASYAGIFKPTRRRRTRC